MKHVLSLFALLLIYSWLAMPTAAQPRDTRQGPPGPNPERRQRLLDEFDTNDDGQLSDEERSNARELMRDRRRDDGDQRERGLEDRGPRRNDGPGDRPRRDGRPEGRQQFGGPPEGRVRPDGPPRRPAGPPSQFIDPRALFDQFDENNDDQLSREEFLSLSFEVIKMRTERFAQMGPPASGRGPMSPGFDDGRRPNRDRLGRPDFRRPGRERRDEPGRPNRPAAEEAAGAVGGQPAAADVSI